MDSASQQGPNIMAYLAVQMEVMKLAAVSFYKFATFIANIYKLLDCNYS